MKSSNCKRWTAIGLLCLMQFFSPRLCQSADDRKDAGNSKTLARAGLSAVNVGVYPEQIRTNYGVGEGLPSANVLSIVFDKVTLAATEKGIGSFENGRWRMIYESPTAISQLAAEKGRIWFVRDNQIFELSGTTAKMIASVSPSAKIRALCPVDGSVFIGTDSGVYVADGDRFYAIEAVNELLSDNDGLDIRQLAHHSDELAIAAKGGLVSYRIEQKEAKILTPRSSSAGWAPNDVRGVGFDRQGALWFASPQGVGKRVDQKWNLYTGYDGLPYNDFTCLATGASTDVWFGTKVGAIRFDGTNWEYREGKRWLADGLVNSIALSPTGDAWFATPLGVTRIENRATTLRQKSAFFNEEIERFHRRTEYGYVDAAYLETPGDKSKAKLHDSDNDGLWTSMYGAAQCFEYAVTKSPESKKRANDALRAVAFLSEVTQGGKHGAPFGFPARSILPTSGPNPNERDNRERDLANQKNDPLWKVLEPRWPVSADGKWYWKTDTSSDELDGHYFLYALYYDLVAETDEEKAAVKAVVDRITTHLVDHGYALIDHDGQPTRWGRFGPEVLNTDLLTDCRGLNSISFLSYLIAAHHVTGDAKYLKHYHELLEKHNYYTNVLNPKHQNGPGAGNQSDDEMAFMCYYNLLNYERDPKLRHQYMRSMVRYFAQEESERCPLFSFIFATFYEPVRYYWKSIPEQLIVESAETLKRFPMDRIHWGYKNSHRLDVVPLGPHIVQFEGRGHLRNGKVLPIDERFVNHWNVDPWRLDSRANGRELADGTSYLLPYWLGVYHKLITDDSAKK